MTIYIDLKKKTELKIDNSYILSKASALSSGATLTQLKNEIDWQEIKSVIGIRNTSRNNPLGLVFTKPNQKQFLVETIWEDTGDGGQTDGDMFLFTSTLKDIFELEKLKPNDVKKRFPAWHPYHHESKDYLI